MSAPVDETPQADRAAQSALSREEFARVQEVAERMVQEARQELAQAENKASLLLSASFVVVSVVISNASSGGAFSELDNPVVQVLFWLGLASAVYGMGLLVLAILPRFRNIGDRNRLAFFAARGCLRRGPDRRGRRRPRAGAARARRRRWWPWPLSAPSTGSPTASSTSAPSSWQSTAASGGRCSPSPWAPSSWPAVGAAGAAAVTSYPSGLVTLLFTDIEGSTRTWEAHPELMRTVLARHDEILRTEIEAAQGYVFKTVGDAFCAALVEQTGWSPWPGRVGSARPAWPCRRRPSCSMARLAGATRLIRPITPPRRDRAE